MIGCSRQALLCAAERIVSYAQTNKSGEQFFVSLAALGDISLQSSSLGSDLAFFGEAGRALNAAAAIAADPHIENARELAVVRAERAHGVNGEAFVRTLRDARLWRDKQGTPSPAQVYCVRYRDELKNYENDFLVYLLDLLARRLTAQAKFYDFLVGTLVRGGTLTQASSTLEHARAVLAALTQKLGRLQRTVFYRTLAAEKREFACVEATNVLKHHPAYAACYRFYLRFFRAGEEEERGYAAYCYVRLLLALREKGYRFVRETGFADSSLLPALALTDGQFEAEISPAESLGGVVFCVRPQGEKFARHLLLFDPSFGFPEVKSRLSRCRPSDMVSSDVVGVWDLAYLDGEALSLGLGWAKEDALYARYLEDMTRQVRASRQIYTAVCASCGGKHVSLKGGGVFCPDCGSIYTFSEQGGEETLWFRRLRRKIGDRRG